jgi:O-antigen/teichoic acid export membrane protein
LFARAAGIIATSADVVMIGWLLSARDVGLYSVAAKISIVSTIFLQVTSSVIAPKVASMYAENNIKEMEKMIQRVTKYLILTSTLIFVGIIVFGKLILLIWGAEFVDSYSVLVILGFGNFINISAGAVGLILTMCNQERVWGILMFASAILNVIFNYFLISIWGILGAGISTAVSLIFMNITAIYVVKKRIGILTIPLRNFRI